MADCRLKTAGGTGVTPVVPGVAPGTRVQDEVALRLFSPDPAAPSKFRRDAGINRRDACFTRPVSTIVNRKLKIVNAFTLIELLAVIAIIGVLAAFTIPVLDAVKKRQVISNTQAELGQLDAAIKSYHATYGFYPPDNHNNPPNPAINQLYYELMGVANNGGTFKTLDGQATITSQDAQTTFGVPGFMNCTKTGSGEDATQARSFLVGLRPNQLGTNGINSASIPFLCASVGGPDDKYPSSSPVSPDYLGGVTGLNPWRYNSSNPTNNPGGYDLWVQISINGTKYLICNWTKTVQVNNPLP